ncbi:MAG TPA: DUF6491 family protein [Allosphingosinicella sp.]|jgi:hypothetical protein
MRLAPMTILLLAAFSTAAMPKSDRSDLAKQLAGRTAGPPQDCVSMDTTANLRPVNEQTLIVERGPILYVNHLRGGCPGLEATDTIILQANGNQYCRGDHFRTRPFGGGVVPGPICVLGDFTPYRRTR